jgi:hypothetical protein
MAIMATMKGDKSDKLERMYVRPTTKALHAMKRLLAAAQSTKQIRALKQEEMISASWEWLELVDIETFAKGIAPFVRERREFLNAAEPTTPERPDDLPVNVRPGNLFPKSPDPPGKPGK